MKPIEAVRDPPKHISLPLQTRIPSPFPRGGSYGRATIHAPTAGSQNRTLVSLRVRRNSMREGESSAQSQAATSCRRVRHKEGVMPCDAATGLPVRSNGHPTKQAEAV